MARFKSSEQLKEVLGGFFQVLFDHPEIGEKLKSSKIKIQFAYRDPELTISADLGKDPILMSFDDEKFQPEVKLSMKADVAHKFWHGKVNLLAAMTMRQIVAKGPIPKVLKLLPAIKPAYQLYPQYLAEKGWGDLVLK